VMITLMMMMRRRIQTSKVLCRLELLGSPTENAHYYTAMLREMTTRGHKVKSITKMAANVMSMLEKIGVQEEADRLKATEGITMTREMKKEYVVCVPVDKHEQGDAPTWWLGDSDDWRAHPTILWGGSSFP
jgi:hypothetical protein